MTIVSPTSFLNPYNAERNSGYALALSIFFIGYLCCEVPSNLLLTRARPSWYLSGIMVVWGALCACMATLKTYSGLLALRFFLGCVEAGFFPGVLFIMSCWYKKNEIGKFYLRRPVDIQPPDRCT